MNYLLHRMFDKDGDGTVSTKELGAVLRSLGNNPTQDEIENMIDVSVDVLNLKKFNSFNIEIFQDADADGSGSVDFTEFVELMIKREAEKETPEDLKQAFRVFDKVTEGLKCIDFILHLTHPSQHFQCQAYIQ